MRAIPAVPGKRRGRGRLRSLPLVPVHHRQAISENVNPREPPVFEDVAAALRLQKGEAQQHHHARAKLDRVCRELGGQLERRISTMASQPSGSLALHQEVTAGEIIWTSVIHEVTSR